MEKSVRRKKKVVGTAERPRLVVYRSLKNIYGQVIDDRDHKVLLAASNVGKSVSSEVSKAKTKTDKSFAVGKVLAEAAKKKKIDRVIFDRNGYLYHGRVKAFAEGLRKGGLKF
jgi:large subunit ribosomal protein L18